MPARSVVFLLLAVLLVAGAIAVSQCSRTPSPPGIPAPPTEADTPALAESGDPVLVRARVMLLTHAGAGTLEGTRLLALSRDVAGGVITPDQITQFDADLGVLLAAGQASIASSPSAMIASGEPASLGVGQIGAAPASAFNLDLDLLATSYVGGVVDGDYALRLSLQTGAVEIKLAELGLPVGDRGLVRIDATSNPGDTLLGLRELPRSSDLGAAIILLIAPQAVPTAPAAAPETPLASPEAPDEGLLPPDAAPAEPADAPAERDG